MSFEEFQRQCNTPGRKAFRYAMYMLASPFILAVAYLVIVCALGTLWWLSSMLDSSGAMFPWLCVLATFAVAAHSLENRRTHRLYAKYLAVCAATASDHHLLTASYAPSEQDR